MDEFVGVVVGLVAGAVFLALGFPLAGGKVRPNRWYGYRTRSTLEREDVWYAVNTQSGRHLMVIGALLIVCGLAGLAALHDPRQQQMLVLVCIVIVGLGLAYSLIAGYQQIEQLTGANHQ